MGDENQKKLQLIPVLLYTCTSIVISMVYKSVLSSYNFSAPFFLLSLQTAVALAFTTFAQGNLAHSKAFFVPKFDVEVYKKSILPGVLFVLNIAVGFLGLRLVNVPMFLAVRRTTTVFVMLGEWIILSRTPSTMAMTAVALIATGTVVAGSETFAAEFMGFLFTIGNNILTAIGLNISRKFSDQTSISGFGMVYYNSLTALPLSLALVVLSGELTTLQSFEGYTAGFWASTLLASCLGVVMTFAVFWCTTTNSPVVTSVAGNMKDIVSTFVGAILFPGFVSSPRTITGLLVAFSGSSLYTYAKLTGQALVNAVTGVDPNKAVATGGTAEERQALVEGGSDNDDHNA